MIPVPAARFSHAAPKGPWRYGLLTRLKKSDIILITNELDAMQVDFDVRFFVISVAIGTRGVRARGTMFCGSR
jgi:hypothetical protein